MRIRRKFFAAMSALAAAVGFGAHGIGSASAATVYSFSDAVIFSACTSSVTPAVPVVGLPGGGGTYSFSSANTCPSPDPVPGVCLGVSDPPIDNVVDNPPTPTPVFNEPPLGEIPNNLPNNNCTISASGGYTNIECGTGSTGPGDAANVWADDYPAVNNPATPVYATITYGITFVAGIGVIIGTSTEPLDSPGVGLVFGVVQITPEGGGNCVTVPVGTFRATGLAAVFDPVVSV